MTCGPDRVGGMAATISDLRLTVAEQERTITRLEGTIAEQADEIGALMRAPSPPPAGSWAARFRERIMEAMSDRKVAESKVIVAAERWYDASSLDAMVPANNTEMRRADKALDEAVEELRALRTEVHG
jgi:hypothetical protein